MLRPDEIGSGRVARKINMCGVEMPRGTELTREQILRMPATNRNAMIENRYIEIFPLQTTVKRVSEAAIAAVGAKHVYARGFGKYDVVQGNIIAQGVTRDEADAIAGKPVEARAPEGQVAPAAKSPPKRAKVRRAKRAKRKAPPQSGDQQNGPIEG